MWREVLVCLKLTIERLDSWKVLLEAHVLSVNISKISDEEGILLASVARLMIDGLNSLLESVSNQRLRADINLEVKVNSIAVLCRVDIGVARLDCGHSGRGHNN